MRIDPHILTEARNSLVQDGTIAEYLASIPFFHLATASPILVARKVKVLDALHTLTNTQDFTTRLGQALEIEMAGRIRTGR